LRKSGFMHAPPLLRGSPFESKGQAAGGFFPKQSINQGTGPERSSKERMIDRDLECTPPSRIRVHRWLPLRPLPPARPPPVHIEDARAGVDQVVVRREGEEQRLLDEGADEVVAVAVFVKLPDRCDDPVAFAENLQPALLPRRPEQRAVDDVVGLERRLVGAG